MTPAPSETDTDSSASENTNKPQKPFLKPVQLQKRVMLMPKLGIDVSSYQGSSVSYFHNFKKLGADFAVVKLTEGTNYLNPKASAQVTNSLKVFGSVSVYHFFHGAGTAEAKYF